MSRFLHTSALAFLLLGLPSLAQAQAPQVNPFTFYYGVYLPRQAALAAQPSVRDSIRQYSVERQYSAVTERAGLYDPAGPIGLEGYDPLQPFGSQAQRRSRPRLSPGGIASLNLNGQGPSDYFNRTASFHPRLATGRSVNANIYKPQYGVRPRQGMPGMGAMAGMGGGMR
jgi:hypothetical protein